MKITVLTVLDSHIPDSPLRALLMALMLACAAPSGAVASPDLQVFMAGSPAPGEAVQSGAQTRDASPSASSGLPAGELEADAGREDLTAFFSIGIIVDVLLIAAFVIWAVGQWRKTRK